MRQLSVLACIATTATMAASSAHADTSAVARTADRYVVVKAGAHVYTKMSRKADRVLLDRARPFRLLGERRGWVRLQTLMTPEGSWHCYPILPGLSSEGDQLTLFTRANNLSKVTTEEHDIRAPDGGVSTYAIGVQVSDLPHAPKSGTGRDYHPTRGCSKFKPTHAPPPFTGPADAQHSLLWPNGSKAGKISDLSCFDRPRRGQKRVCCEVPLVASPRPGKRSGTYHSDDAIRVCVKREAVEITTAERLALEREAESMINAVSGPWSSRSGIGAYPRRPRNNPGGAIRAVTRPESGGAAESGTGGPSSQTGNSSTSSTGGNVGRTGTKTRSPRSPLDVGTIEDEDETSLEPSRVKRKIQAAYMDGLERCHKELLKRAPKAKGTVTLKFMVGPTGRIARVLAKGFDQTLDRCIEKQAKSWRFAAPKDEDGDATDATFKLSLACNPR